MFNESNCLNQSKTSSTLMVAYICCLLGTLSSRLFTPALLTSKYSGRQRINALTFIEFTESSTAADAVIVRGWENYSEHSGAASFRKSLKFVILLFAESPPSILHMASIFPCQV